MNDAKQWRLSDQLTPNGHPVDEAASALQKCIRRGMEREALYFAAELAGAGYDGYAFRRLRIIASEDVGLADPLTVVLVRALYENFVEARKEKKHGDCALYLTHAVMALARCPKSRATDDACAVMFSPGRSPLDIDEVAPWAVDHHTARGRGLGRTEASSYTESYRLENEADVPNPYAREEH